MVLAIRSLHCVGDVGSQAMARVVAVDLAGGVLARGVFRQGVAPTPARKFTSSLSAIS